MKKFVCLLISFGLIFSAFPANQWQEGTGEDTILGTISPSDIDKDSFQNAIDPLDRLLTNYQEGCKIVYTSASTITVEAGEIMLSNAAGTIKLMQQNTSDTTVTWSDIDTGAEASSTTYYLYAYMDTVTTSTFSVTISTSSSAPTGKTYYARLGSFLNDSSSDIQASSITNDNVTTLDEDARIKGWVQFNGTGTIAIQDSYNVTSITDNGTGLYTITWDTDFSNDDYAVVAIGGVGGDLGPGDTLINAVAAGSCQVRTYASDNSARDGSIISVIAIGDQ